MLGYYNHTVILTYVGLISSIIGINASLSGMFVEPMGLGHYGIAIICLLISGLCDLFDGRIARAAKNRTDAEKRFGIQIDSLCDLVCFGIFPIIICYSMGMQFKKGPMGFFNVFVMCLYGLAAVIRLGYFNVTEEIRQNSTDECRKEYSGLPVTTIAIILPVYFQFTKMFRIEPHIYIPYVMLVVAILFILDFKVKKPTLKQVIFLSVLAIIAILRYILHKTGFIGRG